MADPVAGKVRGPVVHAVVSDVVIDRLQQALEDYLRRRELDPGAPERITGPVTGEHARRLLIYAFHGRADGRDWLDADLFTIPELAG